MATPMKEGEDEKEGLTDKIICLENYYAFNVLHDELKEIYAEMQIQFNDFRTNVFFKNLDDLDNKLGNFDIEPKSHMFSMGNIDEMTKKITTQNELLKYYTKKANEMQ